MKKKRQFCIFNWKTDNSAFQLALTLILRWPIAGCELFSYENSQDTNARLAPLRVGRPRLAKIELARTIWLKPDLEITFLVLYAKPLLADVFISSEDLSVTREIWNKIKGVWEFFGSTIYRQRSSHVTLYYQTLRWYCWSLKMKREKFSMYFQKKGKILNSNFLWKGIN